MSYKRGRAFEYRVRDIFREYGYECDRKAASSPYDLLVHKNGKTIFLGECKKTRVHDCIYVSKDDVAKLLEESRKHSAIPLLLYGFDRTPVFVIRADELKSTRKMYKLQEGGTLRDFLKTFKQKRRKNKLRRASGGG